MTNTSKKIRKPRALTIRQKALAKNAVGNGRYSAAIAAAKRAWGGAEFVEEADGQRVRIWSDDAHNDCVKADDVRSWLLGQRVVVLREGLEFVRKGYIESMLRDGYLRQEGGMVWVTEKAAKRWSLPKVMGCKFPPESGEFGKLAPAKAA